MVGDPDEYADRVLDLVERIPPGRVMTYGDVAEYLGGGGPRQVGRVMARYGGGVPWWRVIRADGTPLPGHERRALAHYRREGTPLRARGGRVDMAAARWDGREPPARRRDVREAPAGGPDVREGPEVREPPAGGPDPRRG